MIEGYLTDFIYNFIVAISENNFNAPLFNFIIVVFISSYIIPGFSEIIIYGIWFIYYIYVIIITMSISETSCNCKPNTTYKSLVLIIFGLLILFNLILHKLDKSVVKHMKTINNILFIIGTILITMFYIDLEEKGCTCTNYQAIGTITFVNIITIAIQLIKLYLKLY